MARIGLRWTIGEVNPFGFEALRLSVWGAHRAFGSTASYAICVNTMPVAAARALTGSLPAAVRFHPVTRAQTSPALERHLDGTLADGAGWAVTPPRMFPEAFEIAIDNELVAWAMPPSLRAWLDAADPGRCLLAAGADGEPCTALYGMPPGLDLDAALAAVLAEGPGILPTRAAVHALLVTAASRGGPPAVVPLEEVSACSPFPPGTGELGTAGARFLRLNDRAAAFGPGGDAAERATRRLFLRHRDALYRKVDTVPGPQHVALAARL